MTSTPFLPAAISRPMEGAARLLPGCWTEIETGYRKVKLYSELVVSTEGKRGARGVLPG